MTQRIYGTDYSGFVYIWRDRKHKRFYVGSHMGKVDSGYVCSSTWMKNSYTRRPHDFKRRILSWYKGDDRHELYALEDRWLKLMKEGELRTRYFNLSRVAKGIDWTPELRAGQSERMKTAWTPERRAAHSAKLKAKWEEKGVDGYRDRDNHAASIAGKPRPDTASRNKTWIRSEATKAKMSQSAKARVTGTKWFTDGHKQSRHIPGNEPEGWTQGRVR